MSILNFEQPGAMSLVEPALDVSTKLLEDVNLLNPNPFSPFNSLKLGGLSDGSPLNSMSSMMGPNSMLEKIGLLPKLSLDL